MQDLIFLYTTEVGLVILGMLIGIVFTCLIKKSFTKSGSSMKAKQFKKGFELLLVGILLILIIAFINLLLKL